MYKLTRFVAWICSKFNKEQIEFIVKELTAVLNKKSEFKPKDDFKEKHPNYRNFYVDSCPPLSDFKT